MFQLPDIQEVLQQISDEGVPAELPISVHLSVVDKYFDVSESAQKTCGMDKKNILVRKGKMQRIVHMPNEHIGTIFC